AGYGAVHNRVADDDVLGGIALELRRGLHADAAARQALADIVVRLADEVERDAARKERTEALPRAAGKLDVDGVVRQARVAVSPGYFRGQHRAHRAIDVADGHLDLDRFAPGERRLRKLDEAMVQ